MNEPRFGGIDAHNAMQAAERILDDQVNAVAEHDRHILFRTRMQHRVHGTPATLVLLHKTKSNPKQEWSNRQSWIWKSCAESSSAPVTAFTSMVANANSFMGTTMPLTSKSRAMKSIPSGG